MGEGREEEQFSNRLCENSANEYRRHSNIVSPKISFYFAYRLGFLVMHIITNGTKPTYIHDQLASAESLIDCLTRIKGIKKIMTKATGIHVNSSSIMLA